MEPKSEKLYKKLTLYFWLELTIIIGVFIFLLLRDSEVLTTSDSIIYERYAIILTLVAIPGALKLFHRLSKKALLQVYDLFLEKMRTAYLLRSLIIDLAIVMSLVGYVIYGASNFVYLVIVLIFSKFFCIPSRESLAEIEVEPTGDEVENEPENNNTDE